MGDIRSNPNYTCILPMASKEPLGQSAVWESLVREIGREGQHDLRAAEREAVEVAEEDPRLGRGALLKVLLLFRITGTRGLAAECAEHDGYKPSWKSVAEDLFNTRVDSIPIGTSTNATFGQGSVLSEKQVAQAKEGVDKLVESVRNMVKPASKPMPRRLQGAEHARDVPCNATPGYFCLSTLFVNQNLTLTPLEKCMLTRSVNPCPAGFFCVGGEQQPKACPIGSSCMGGEKAPQRCGGGYYCPVSSLRYRCGPGYVCWMRSHAPNTCPGGFYCPEGRAVPCPESHFCPSGSARPVPCALLAECPERSSRPRWFAVARWSLTVGGSLWVVAMRAVPRWLHSRGGPTGALLSILALTLLCAAWFAKLELLHLAAWHFRAGVDTDFLSMRALCGGSPHSTALVFLTLAYAFLLYGLFISPRIQTAAVQAAVDLAVCAGICLTFNAYMQDWSAVAFVCAIWVAFRIFWVLLTQQGTLALRASLLAVGFVALALGLLLLQAPELVQLLLLALVGSVVKEILWEVLPLARFAIRRRRVQGMESLLCDNSFMPLLHALMQDSPMATRHPEAHPTTAARVATAARMSLTEDSGSGLGGEGEGSLSSAAAGTADQEAWTAWLAHYRGVSGDDDGVIDISDDAEGARGVAFDLRGVSYCLDDKRKLLKELTFIAPAGAKVAIMGASGSGKTTLLSVLSGRCGDGRFAGELRLDGAPVLPSQMAELRPLIGYVPQDDVMHLGLSARENIEFQAELRMPRDIASEEPCSSEEVSSFLHSNRGGAGGRCLAERVGEVLGGLGLGHVADRAVGSGLSGGQRKRVSIGMEVVTKPRVLFMDEPSSGLDTSTAHRIIELVVKGESTDNVTTFATIHQPRWSTLGLFDMLIVLAPGGYLAFAGPIAAVKSYFREVLHVDFPSNQNPADVIIDACTFESARKMATEGTWKQPPQCLRAVLFPLPEVVTEECESHWQPEEFGSMLASLWRSFAAATQRAACGNDSLEGDLPGPASAPPSQQWRALAQGREIMLRPLDAEGRGLPWSFAPRGLAADQRFTEVNSALGRAARARAEGAHWGQQVWLHVARTLLVTCRALWPAVAISEGMLVVAVKSLAFAFGGLDMTNMFLPLGILFLLVCCTQSVAAQRIFGGEEQQVAWREASVCSLWQVLSGFLGKDLASLTEIVLSTMCFALVYWPLSDSFLSGSDFAAVGFALLYCIWGLSHIWAILFPRHTAMLFAVVIPFLGFLFSGLRPDIPTLASSLGGYGSLLLLASPNRWAMAYFLTRQVNGIGSTYLADPVKELVNKKLGIWSFSLDDNAQCPDYSAVTIERWKANKGFSCHTGQLFLLGFLFRFLAAACLLFKSSSKSSGGELPLGVSSRIRSRILRDAIVIFLVFFFLFELLLLGQTY